MEKMDSKMQCPKCEFQPTYSTSWELEHKDQCYATKCGWKDKTVQEHMHMKCPVCGYIVAAPTADYNELSGNVWTSGTTETKITTPPVNPGRNAVKADVLPLINACNAHRASTGGVAQPNTTVTPIKQNAFGFVQTPVVPTKCRTCPVEADGSPRVAPVAE